MSAELQYVTFAAISFTIDEVALRSSQHYKSRRGQLLFWKRLSAVGVRSRLPPGDKAFSLGSNGDVVWVMSGGLNR